MSYNLGYDLTPTSKFQSERHIFDFNKMMVHIPSNRTNYPQTNKKIKETANANKLETTSITPLDIVSLDNNVLFISTLDSNWTRSHSSGKSSTMMKRQTSHTPERTKSIQYHTRRYSQPESHREPTPSPPFVYYDNNNNNNKRNLYHDRRTSVQSDAASSTELIRRFSSESTTSSVVTHLSWVATSAPTKVAAIDEHGGNIKTCQSNVLNDAQTIMSDKQQQQQKQQKQQQQQQQHQHNEPQYPKQENVAISCTSSTNTTNTSISSGNKQKEEQQKQEQQQPQQKNICDTRNNLHRHSPSVHQQQQHHHPLSTSPSPPPLPPTSSSIPLKQQQQQQQKQVPPVWSDPIKIKENPVRYEYTISYLSEREIPPQSTLPLPKPCVFYFSDTNNNNEVATDKSKNYSATIKPLFECDTAWNFSSRWRLFNKEVKVSQLYINQNVYCFVKGVEPMWEDTVNRDGGRLTMYPMAMVDEMFEWILFCLVGGSLLDQGAVGVVVSRRARGDRIELWLDSSASQATLPDLKKTLCSMLPESCHLAINESRFKKHF